MLEFLLSVIDDSTRPIHSLPPIQRPPVKWSSLRCPSPSRELDQKTVHAEVFVVSRNSARAGDVGGARSALVARLTFSVRTHRAAERPSIARRARIARAPTRKASLASAVESAVGRPRRPALARTTRDPRRTDQVRRASAMRLPPLRRALFLLALAKAQTALDNGGVYASRAAPIGFYPRRGRRQ